MKILKSVLITVLSLIAALLLCLGGWHIATSVGAPVEYKDLTIIDKTFENGVLTVTVQSKAAGLYCSGFNWKVKDGDLFLTITGTPIDTGNETFTAIYTVNETVYDVIYEYKYDKNTLMSIQDRQSEDVSGG